MKERLITIVVLLLACELFAISCGGSSVHEPTLDEGFQQVTMGMSLDNVVVLMGEPTQEVHYELYPTVTYYFWDQPNNVQPSYYAIIGNETGLVVQKGMRWKSRMGG